MNLGKILGSAVGIFFAAMLFAIAVDEYTVNGSEITTKNVSVVMEKPLAGSPDTASEGLAEEVATEVPPPGQETPEGPRESLTVLADADMQGAIESALERNQHKLSSLAKSELKKDKKHHLILRHRQSAEATLPGAKRLTRQHSTLQTSPEELAAVLDDDAVEFVEIDQELRVQADWVPWNVQRVGATWNQMNGSGIKVAILDTGVGPHPDLQVVGGWNAIDETGEYEDTVGHGTAVAGVLAATLNNEGLVGVSPGVELYSVKVAPGRISDAMRGVQWAIDNDVDIITMSFSVDAYSETLKDALREAYDAGVLLVAASGNDGLDQVNYPAAYSSVIAVGAVDGNDQRAAFSNYGFDLELVAPGVNINSTDMFGGYTVSEGTSYAAPHVAGVAALVWSFNRSLTNEEVRAKLLNNATDLGAIGKDAEYGHGLAQVQLNAMNISLANTSYQYDIYNISSYGEENETILFLLSGYGTIDDISFSPGYYIVTRYLLEPRNSTIFVDENSTTHTVDYRPYNRFSDNYYKEGTSTDAKVWKQGSLQFQYYESGSYGDADVVCYDYNYLSNPSFTTDYCYAASSTARSNCKSRHSDLNSFCGSSNTNCNSSGLTAWHSMPSTQVSSMIREELAMRVYYDCDVGFRNPVETSGDTYYVFDQKRTECVPGEPWNFRTEGRFATDDYQNIGTLACAIGKVCDNEIAGDYVTNVSSYDFLLNNNPCRLADGEICTTNNECLTGHSCTNGICTAPSGETVDLAIVSIIPIQVVSNVDMITRRKGHVIVNVTNFGTASARGTVRAWFDESELQLSSLPFPNANTNNRTIAPGNYELFIFDFNPARVGSIGINANISLTG